MVETDPQAPFASRSVENGTAGMRGAGGNVPPLPELRLGFGNPMAAGCEGNSVPEAAGCGYRGTCGCAWVVRRSPGPQQG